MTLHGVRAELAWADGGEDDFDVALLGIGRRQEWRPGLPAVVTEAPRSRKASIARPF
jgi:hypothetical protein